MHRIAAWLLSDVSPILRALVALSGCAGAFACLVWWRGSVTLVMDTIHAMTLRSGPPGFFLFCLGMLSVVVGYVWIGLHAALAWSRHRGISVLLVIVWVVATLLFLPLAFYLRVSHGIATHGMKLPY